jgi:hypothetical protein
MATNISTNSSNYTATDIKTLQGLTGEQATTFNVCKVESINEDKTVNVSILSGNDSNKIIHNVRVASPYKSATSGIAFYPEVGSMAILLTISESYKFIITYFSVSDVTAEITKELDLGEIFFKTPCGSFIKMNNDNSIDIHTGSSTAFLMENDEIMEMSESKTEINLAKEEFSGVKNGNVLSEEKYYDKDIESKLSDSELLEEASDLLYVDIPLEKRVPIIEVSKGSIVDDNNNKVKMSIYDSFNPDVAYMLKVNGSQHSFNLKIGKDGSLQIDANIVKLSCEKLDIEDTTHVKDSKIVFTKDGD